MKLRLYKTHMRHALLWYNNKLSEEFVGTLLTPANVEIIRMRLFQLQKKKQTAESNLVWHVPVDVQIDQETQTFEVYITDDSNLLYLDFDQP